MPFEEFARSFKLVPETRPDPALMSPSVNRVGDGAAVVAIQDGFRRWCDANRGQFRGSEAFKDAAVEYLHLRIKKQPSLEGMRINAVTCLGGDQAPLGAYINVGNADVAFYDKAQVAAFIEHYSWNEGRLARDQVGKLRNCRSKSYFARDLCEHESGDRCYELTAKNMFLPVYHEGDSCERATGCKCYAYPGGFFLAEPPIREPAPRDL